MTCSAKNNCAVNPRPPLAKTQVQMATGRSDDTIATVKGWFMCTDWNRFHDTHVDEAAESVTGYINFCVNGSDQRKVWAGAAENCHKKSLISCRARPGHCMRTWAEQGFTTANTTVGSCGNRINKPRALLTLNISETWRNFTQGWTSVLETRQAGSGLTQTPDAVLSDLHQKGHWPGGHIFYTGHRREVDSSLVLYILQSGTTVPLTTTIRGIWADQKLW